MAKLETYKREGLELKGLREEFAEMGQTLVNLDRRLITTDLYLSDRLLRIWEHVKHETSSVSQEIQEVTSQVKVNGQRSAVLLNLAQELDLFLVNAKALGINVEEECKEYPLFEQAAVPAPHLSIATPLASHVNGPSPSPFAGGYRRQWPSANKGATPTDGVLNRARE